VDLNDSQLLCDICIHDVPHAPRPSRRLPSVDQEWNAARGETWFHPEHATLQAVDSDAGEARSFGVAKPFTLLRNVDGLPSASSQKSLPIVREEHNKKREHLPCNLPPLL
jgi:hypothetical protein